MIHLHAASQGAAVNPWPVVGGVAVVLFTIGFVWLFMTLSTPPSRRSERGRRAAKRFDNIATARTTKDMLRAVVTPADRFEQSAEVRLDRD